MNNKFVSLWVPVLFWCFLIFVISGIPSLKTDLGFYDLLLRKAAHIAEYAVLFILMRRATGQTFLNLKDAGVIIISLVFSVLYACSDEFHQAFVPGRGPSVADVSIDAIGALLGFALIILRRNSAPIEEKI